MAAYDAARQMKERLVAFAAEKWKVPASEVEFLPNRVRIGGDIISFPDFINQAYFARVQLSAAGFYKTPGNPLGPLDRTRTTRSIITPMAPPFRKSRSIR